MNSNRENSHNSGRNIGAVILIGLGVMFLMGQFLNLNIGSMFGRLFSFDWPFYIILPGAALLAVALVGSERTAPLAIPGAIVTGTGAILLFQERFDRYESWSYMWALYPVFVGLGLMFMGGRTSNRTQVEAGRRSVIVGLALFVIFGVFMESIYTGAFGDVVRYFVPIILIGGGAFLLLRGRSMNGQKRKHDDLLPNGYNGKRKNDRLNYGPSASVTPGLQRQIDAALAEDDPNDNTNV